MAITHIQLEFDDVVWQHNGTQYTTKLSTFPAGTRMFFRHTSAPVGWTKEAVHNNKALRLVSGNVSSGGSHAFSTVYGKTATSAHTLTTGQMPQHRHQARVVGGHAQNSVNTMQGRRYYSHNRTYYTSYSGSTKSHSHGIDIRVQYVDIIIAVKDAA